MKTDKESYYFRHYADARNDPKIVSLIMDHGMEGYGVFWAILEMLRTAQNYEIDYDPKILSHQLSVNCRTIVGVCQTKKIFVVQNNKLSHESFKNFLLHRSETYRKNRLSSQLSDNCQSVVNQLTDKPRILKERKGKESKFIKPTIEEIRAYCAEKGFDLDPAYFWNYYETRGWSLGKNQIKDWKACVRTWMIRNRKETNEPKLRMFPDS